jgi:protein-disulfide isomerase
MLQPMRATIRTALIFSIAALLACGSSPAAQSPQDVEALKKELASLKKDVAEIREFLKAATGGRFGAPKIEDMSIDLGGAPAKGQPNAPVTLVEVSDYHCPFCQRHAMTTQPQIDKEYVASGKVRHVFIHLPIDQLHPEAFRSHEGAACANEQGKFWELHAKLFQKPVRTTDEIVAAGQSAGLDAAALRACLDSGKYKEAVRESVKKMSALGVGSTPMFLVGKTPPAGKPMEIDAVVEGAHPFEQFKSSLDALLQAR